jgi:hypothetical protein
LLEVFIALYKKFTQLFQQDLGDSTGVLQDLISSVSPFISDAQANQDNNKIMTKALSDLNQIIQDYKNLETGASKITCFLRIYRGLKTIEGYKQGTFGKVLDHFRDYLSSLRIYDVLQGIDQHIKSKQKENPTAFNQSLEISQKLQILLEN